MFKKLTAGFVTGVCVLVSVGTMAVMADDLYFVTGGPMGTYYAVGSALADVLNPLLPESKLVIESSGASRANLEMIEEGDAQFGTVQNDVMYYASTGTSLFDGEDPYTNFSAVAGLYDETIQIITCDDAIKTVADLAGKKVSVGDAGSGVEFNAREILEAYGLSFDDIEVVNASFGDSANSLREAVVPAGTYAGVEEDIVTVSVRATLVASNAVSEDLVYDLLKAAFENKDALIEKQAKFESLNAEDAVKGMSVSFHAGAKKYYEEQGITVE